MLVSNQFLKSTFLIHALAMEIVENYKHLERKAKARNAVIALSLKFAQHPPKDKAWAHCEEAMRNAAKAFPQPMRINYAVHKMQMALEQFAQAPDFSKEDKAHILTLANSCKNYGLQLKSMNKATEPVMGLRKAWDVDNFAKFNF